MSPFLLTLPPMPETPYIWNWMLSSYQKRHTNLNSYCRENGHLFELWIMSALCYRRRHGGSESSLMWPHHLAIGTYSMRAPKKEWGGGGSSCTILFRNHCSFSLTLPMKSYFPNGLSDLDPIFFSRALWLPKGSGCVLNKEEQGGLKGKSPSKGVMRFGEWASKGGGCSLKINETSLFAPSSLWTIWAF